MTSCHLSIFSSSSLHLNLHLSNSTRSPPPPQLFLLAQQLGLQGLRLPVLLPGTLPGTMLPLAPPLSEEDKQVGG